MARLLSVLSERLADPLGHPHAHPGDLVGLARAYRRRGRPDDALACLESALAQPDPESRLPGAPPASIAGRRGWTRPPSSPRRAARRKRSLRGRRPSAVAAARPCMPGSGWPSIANTGREIHSGRSPLLLSAERLLAQRRALGRFDAFAERDLAPAVSPTSQARGAPAGAGGPPPGPARQEDRPVRR